MAIAEKYLARRLGKCLVKMLLNINHPDCDMNIVQTHHKICNCDIVDYK